MMPMNVLITGVQTVEKDSAVKLAVERLPAKGIRTMSFSDTKEGEGAEELGLLKRTQSRLIENIQKRMLDSGRAHLIINGYCTISTRLGFVPVLTKEAAGIFRPSLVVCLETDPRTVRGDAAAAFPEHQAVERLFSVFIASECGAAVKFIRTGPDGAREAAEELAGILKEALVAK